MYVRRGFGATKAVLHRADAGFGRARAVHVAGPPPKRAAHGLKAAKANRFSIARIATKGWRGLKEGTVALAVGPVTRIRHLIGIPVRLARAAGTRGMPGLERQLREEARDEVAFDREVIRGLAHTVYVGVEMSPAGVPLMQRRIERDGYQRTFEHVAYEGAAQIPNAAAILATEGAVSRVAVLRTVRLAELTRLGPGSRQLIKDLSSSSVKFNRAEIVRIGRDGSGRVVWLETGGEGSGLAHIVDDHAADFARRGVSKAEIPDLVMKAVAEGEVIKYQGRRFTRPIYRVEFGGRTVDVAVTVSDNGYVVGANPPGL